MTVTVRNRGRVALDPATRNQLDAERIKVLDDQIAALQQERKNLANDLAYRLPSGKSILGALSVTVSQVNQYDGDAFLAGLRPGQVQRVTTRTLDRAKAKALYPDRWEAVKENMGRKVSVK